MSRRKAKVIGVLILSALFFPVCPGLYAQTSNKPTTNTLKYDKESVRLDIYNPNNKNAPVIILIHGASGIESDRAERYRDFATDLMREGIIAINVHYFDSAKDNWVKTINKTIEFAKTLANVDAKKIGLVGYSLGGTLALSVASENEDVSLLVVNSGYLPQDFGREQAAKLPQTYILAGTADTAIDTLYKIQDWLTAYGIPVKIKIDQGQGHTIPMTLFNQNWRSILLYICDTFQTNRSKVKHGINIRM